ncbi:hypothetical protein BJ742DRAFT_857667 [Cladochytrium replicatum]|nr:hypothetical protein BJ742DRAFT_857667 [Cladochytrium replicatum]
MTQSLRTPLLSTPPISVAAHNRKMRASVWSFLAVVFVLASVARAEIEEQATLDLDVWANNILAKLPAACRSTCSTYASQTVQCILSGDSIPLDAGSRCMCDTSLRASLKTCFDCRGAGSDFKQLEKVCSEGDLAAAAKIASDNVFNQTREAPKLDIELQVPESFVPVIGDLYASSNINTSGASALTIPVLSLAVAAAIAFFAA